MKLPSSSATELNKANPEHMVSMKDFCRRDGQHDGADDSPETGA